MMHLYFSICLCSFVCSEAKCAICVCVYTVYTSRCPYLHKILTIFKYFLAHSSKFETIVIIKLTTSQTSHYTILWNIIIWFKIDTDHSPSNIVPNTMWPWWDGTMPRQPVADSSFMYYSLLSYDHFFHCNLGGWKCFKRHLLKNWLKQVHTASLKIS